MRRLPCFAVMGLLATGAPVLTHGQPTSPGDRRLGAMVYDAARREVVLFGGYAPGRTRDDVEYPDDLWAWTGQAWRRLEPSGPGRPRGREVPHMAYDAARQRIVMFGGRREQAGQPTEILADVWEWDGVRWRAVENAGMPKVLHATTAYDPVRHRVLMYGGLGDSGLSRSVSEWDGARWSVRDTSGPPGVIAGASAVNPAGQLTLMTTVPSGDQDPAPQSSATWTWNGTTWKRAENGPPFANLQATASAPNGTVYFYQTSERWLTDPVMHVRSSTGVWTAIRTPESPRVYSAAAAYDAARDRFVLYGGGRPDQHFVAETWEFDGRAWSKRE